MSKVEELIAEMRERPTNVRFAEACTVADHFFGAPRQSGTSHRIWKMPWAGDPRVNMQNDSGKAKEYQVQQLLNAVDRWYAEQAKKAEAAITDAEEPPKKKKKKKKGKR